MMKKAGSITVFLMAMIISFSCVPKKKLLEMENLKNKVQGLLKDKENALARLRADNDSLQARIKADQSIRAQLVADTTRIANQKRKLAKDYAAMQAKCDATQKNYEQLKDQSSKKVRDLIDDLEAMQDEMARNRAKDQAALDAREKRLNELQSSLEEAEKNLMEVKRTLAERDSTMNALKQNLSKALLGFADKGLTVEVRDGKVYVSLSNQLLFKSGSTKIDGNGKKALQDLANVLKEQANINVMVEGHTDDVPVSNLGQIKDNWDLSVMRSTEVLRILVEEGVDPTRVIPSGRGEFFPVDPAETTEARAINRRTEIIISPRLDELYQLINNRN